MSEPQVSVIDPVRPAPPAPRPRSGWPRHALIGALVLLGGGAAYYFIGRGGAKAGPGEAAAVGDRDGEGKSNPGAALPVEVTHPRQGGIVRTMTQAASVHSFEHTELYSKLSGYLKAQNVDIGDHVRKDQLLAVIEDPEVDKAVDQAKAAFDQSLAMVKVAEARIRSAQAAQAAAEAMVIQSETEVVAKQSNLDLQEKQFARITDLVRRNAIEQKLADEQQDRRDVAKSDLGMTRAAVLTARAQVQDRAARVQEAEADLSEARAKVEVAQANLDRARVMQDYTRIAAPFDGVVTVRSFHLRAFIRSASEGGNVPVLAVARTDLMRVVVPVPDIDVPFVDRGDEAVLNIVALPGEPFRGKVSRYSYTEDPSSRNMRTEVDLPNPDGRLREGMYGPLTLILQPAAPDSVTIPSSGLAAHSSKGDGTVMLARAGKARKVNVRVGRDTGVEAEIIVGLSTKDAVITSYNGSLEEGTAIKAEERKSAQTGSH